MSQPSHKIIACPRCGNTNAYEAENCLKCDLPLAPIRAAMSNATVSGNKTPGPPTQTREPAPPLPFLPPRPAEKKNGYFVDSWRFLIRGMGNRSNEIAARFFKRLLDRGIAGLRLSVGKLIIQVDGGGRDSRDYYFAERDLGNNAVATMAIRIAPVGRDLFVEWQHFALPSQEVDLGRLVFGIAALLLAAFSCFLVILDSASGHETYAALICLGIGGIAVVFGIAAVTGAWTNRRRSLVGFQSQDSTAFQLAVRAALEEAIDLAGISKSLIQQLPTEQVKDRRVI